MVVLPARKSSCSANSNQNASPLRSPIPTMYPLGKMTYKVGVIQERADVDEDLLRRAEEEPRVAPIALCSGLRARHYHGKSEKKATPNSRPHLNASRNLKPRQRPRVEWVLLSTKRLGERIATKCPMAAALPLSKCTWGREACFWPARRNARTPPTTRSPLHKLEISSPAKLRNLLPQLLHNC